MYKREIYTNYELGVTMLVYKYRFINYNNYHTVLGSINRNYMENFKLYPELLV